MQQTHVNSVGLQALLIQPVECHRAGLPALLVSRAIVSSAATTSYAGSKDHDPAPSMSRRGNRCDNAVAESFLSSLRKERIKCRIYASLKPSQMCISTSRGSTTESTEKSHLDLAPPASSFNLEAEKCLQKRGQLPTLIEVSDSWECPS
jgi:transposase InsO family protein